jgi:hypothetical protein
LHVPFWCAVADASSVVCHLLCVHWWVLCCCCCMWLSYLRHRACRLCTCDALQRCSRCFAALHVLRRRCCKCKHRYPTGCDRHVKPPVLACLGDIALAVGGSFDKVWPQPVLHASLHSSAVLSLAASTLFSRVLDKPLNTCRLWNARSSHACPVGASDALSVRHPGTPNAATYSRSHTHTHVYCACSTWT